MLTAVVGINWGDEGKGRMVDLLSADYNIVCRYQGGNNAGHTVVNHLGKFALHLMPCGIFRETTVNVLGNGMVVDLEHLCKEMDDLKSKGIKISPDNLKISDKATICMPYHRLLEVLEEDRLAEKKQGSTRRGIAPVYSDKYMRKSLRMNDLFDFSTLKEKVEDLVEWKNLFIVGGYKEEAIKSADMLDWLKKYGGEILPYIIDTTEYLSKAADEGKKIMFEGQLGTLRDIEYGIYPYTTSSQAIASYATTGAGIPFKKLDNTIGIMKAFSSSVGEGPFTAEFFGDEAAKFREVTEEYGASTGRPRRVGGFDVPASKYGVRIQGADYLALTKLDMMSYFDKIPVCAAYEIDGVKTTDFPVGDRLTRAKPVYEYLDGFKEDISNCKKPEDLPKNALAYIKYVEKAVNCHIKYVSVGPEREHYIVM
ncbi:MAG: adenylosuccinate synthase [Oscillospiraceae bacterium]|nr:adenylosuccinate synthase [Oscillospiraceae bacterium]